jgi:hypothetical protein
MKCAWAVGIALLVTASAMAKDTPEKTVNAGDKASFDTVSAWVRKQMDTDGRYSFVTADERKTVSANLDRMGQLFEKHGDTAHMSDTEKTGLFNDQEQINAVLAKRDRDRLICRMDTPVGSHIPVKTCQTYGEIEARRKRDYNYIMDETNQKMQVLNPNTFSAQPGYGH